MFCCRQSLGNLIPPDKSNIRDRCQHLREVGSKLAIHYEQAQGCLDNELEQFVSGRAASEDGALLRELVGMCQDAITRSQSHCKQVGMPEFSLSLSCCLFLCLPVFGCCVFVTLSLWFKAHSFSRKSYRKLKDLMLSTAHKSSEEEPFKELSVLHSLCLFTFSNQSVCLRLSQIEKCCNDLECCARLLENLWKLVAGVHEVRTKAEQLNDFNDLRDYLQQRQVCCMKHRQ